MSWINEPTTTPDTRAPSRTGAADRQTSSAVQLALAIIRATVPWLIGVVFILLMIDLIVQLATSTLIGLLPFLIILAVVRALRR